VSKTAQNGVAMELVERESVLQTLQGLLRSTALRGQVALVAGEAGIGKTSVLRVVAADWNNVWWGACDALQTPHPLAPLLDIARNSRPRFAAHLAGPRPALFEAVLDELRLTATPILLVIEDAHWADEATLDWLKFLGRRIERTKALLAISFRDDEVTASHPLRRVLGELPAAVVHRVDLARLSPAAVETLAQRAAHPAAGVHAATHGNPFFVTELLREGGAGVPRSVQDLILARLSRLPPAAQELLRLVSVVPGRIERRLVDALLAPALADVEAALASGLLLAEGAHLYFRHELGRVAVESSLSVPALQAWHARVLAALTAGGHDAPPARLVHHALRANDRAAISRHAPQAATQATQRGAHREAAAQWTIALQHGRPADAPEHRRWLQGQAAALAIMGAAEPLLAALRGLEGLALDRGDSVDAAVQHAGLASPLIGLLRHPEANAAIDEAVARLEPLPPAAAHARVWHLQAWMRMLERDWDDSVHWSKRALALAQSLGDAETARRARATLGCALLFIDYRAGVAEMTAVLEAHRADGNVIGMAGVLTNLGSGAGELMHLVDAEARLRELLALSASHELDGANHYGSAWLSLCLMLRGAWDEAASVASELLARPGASDMSRLMALLALARLRGRRGDPGAQQALDDALALAAPSGTLQRVGPTRAARAEAAFARGDLAAVAAEVGAALPLARAKRHPWFVGELAYWGWRAGIIAQTPGDCAEPFALEMAGHWREAADLWQAMHCPYERARALAEGDPGAQREALAAFDMLGARPAADALRRRLRDAGVRGVARGARPSTREQAFGLTTRELQILRLLCDGLRNAEIAERLSRSVRTVDHHLAAVFAKLGVDSRLAAIQAAQRAGLAPQSGQSPAAK